VSGYGIGDVRRRQRLGRGAECRLTGTSVIEKSDSFGGRFRQRFVKYPGSWLIFPLLGLQFRHQLL
jgi:hypothetical protein